MFYVGPESTLVEIQAVLRSFDGSIVSQAPSAFRPGGFEVFLRHGKHRYGCAGPDILGPMRVAVDAMAAAGAPILWMRRPKIADFQDPVGRVRCTTALDGTPAAELMSPPKHPNRARCELVPVESVSRETEPEPKQFEGCHLALTALEPDEVCPACDCMARGHRNHPSNRKT